MDRRFVADYARWPSALIGRHLRGCRLVVQVTLTSSHGAIADAHDLGLKMRAGSPKMRPDRLSALPHDWRRLAACSPYPTLRSARRSGNSVAAPIPESDEQSRHFVPSSKLAFPFKPRRLPARPVTPNDDSRQPQYLPHDQFPFNLAVTRRFWWWQDGTLATSNFGGRSAAPGIRLPSWKIIIVPFMPRAVRQVIDAYDRGSALRLSASLPVAISSDDTLAGLGAHRRRSTSLASGCGQPSQVEGK